MLDNLNTFLSRTVFTIQGQAISILQLIVIPLLVLVAWFAIAWSARRLTDIMQRRTMDATFILVFRRLYYFLMAALLVFTLLSWLNVPLTAFAFVSGALAIGVGFGAQNILNNFISGWILIWERPIRVGDFLELEDVRGTVESINTRSTRIRRIDGVHLLVPNSHLLENTVVNWTLVDRHVRTVVRVGVVYGAPVQQVAALMQQVAEAHGSILPEPPPHVIFEDFGDNALVFDLYFWVDAFGERDLRMVRSDIRFEIERLFREAGIVIAFPQRDVHLDGTLTIARGER